MRALIQRVAMASVSVDKQVVGSVGRGLCIFVGVTAADDAKDVETLASKTANLRIFEDAKGKLNLSAIDLEAEILVVPQFTLYADTRRGRRPDFLAAARPEQAERLVSAFADRMESLGLRVARGQFQAKMLVEIHNDGPVTIWLDSKPQT